MTNADIIIAGGGIAGLTLAVLLGEAGFAVSIIDRRDPATISNAAPSGRTVALMRASLNIIKAAGVWDATEPHSARLECMRIVDDSNARLGPVDVEFEASDIGLDYFGYNVPSLPFHAALANRLPELPNITVHAPTGLSDYTAAENHVIARLENGEEIRAPLIVGADGANSTVRSLAKIDCWEKSYGQTALTCLINHSKSHKNTSTEFHRPGGPFALVPLPGNCSSIVWVEKSREADRLKQLRKSDFVDALQERTKDVLGTLSLETSPEYWPLRSVKATTLVANRMALIAEAAHVMSPIAAQGLNLSLRDVAALAETVTDARRLGLDIGSFNTLERYEKRRRLDIRTRVFGVNTLNSLVSNEIEPVRMMRRLSLKAMENVLPLRQLAMHQGLVPSIDHGRLARGEAL